MQNTIQSIETNAANLIEQGNMTAMFADILQQPLSHRVGAIAFVAAMAKDAKVVDWCERSLVEIKAVR